MTAWWWAFICGVGIVVVGVSCIQLANIAMEKTPDVNRDTRALLAFAEGTRIRVQIPGEEPVGYYVKISEQAYRALEMNGAYVRIGPAGSSLPITIEPHP